MFADSAQTFVRKGNILKPGFGKQKIKSKVELFVKSAKPAKL